MSTHEHTDEAGRDAPDRPRPAVGPSTEAAWRAPLAYEPVHASVRVPGSKSETNRALVLAALADEPSTITGALDARDTRLMRDALRVLGVRIADAGESWRVTPPHHFTTTGTVRCGLAGTVMRFVAPIAALATGTTHFTGDDEALHRPMGPLLDALYDIGAEVTPGAQTLPFDITGRVDLPGGAVNVDSSTSSQFLSGLLLIGARCARGLDIRHTGASLPSRPHIAMTVSMLQRRGVQVEQPDDNRWVIRPGPISASDLTIEPDLSNAAPFLAAAAITGGQVAVHDWPTSTDQPGALLPEILAAFGAEVSQQAGALVVQGRSPLRGVDLDLSAASELTPVVAALAAVAHDTSHIRGVAHIRGHETDRLAALEHELNNLGSHTRQTDDGLVIHPRVLHGGRWGTYADHRMAHAGALLGLIVDGVELDDIGCTAKTMPQFPELWERMLADSDAYSTGGSE